jgi:hypothetical protein
MPYKLGDRTLPLDRPWVHEEIKYPANWLRLSTAEDRDRLGIVWENSTELAYDQRFYWGYDSDGELIPMDLDQLKASWNERQTQTANQMLSTSDWRVTKASELNLTVPVEWLDYRGAVRLACNTRQAEINACTTVAELKELIDGSITDWPLLPGQTPAEDPVITLPEGTSGSAQPTPVE